MASVADFIHTKTEIDLLDHLALLSSRVSDKYICLAQDRVLRILRNSALQVGTIYPIDRDSSPEYQYLYPAIRRVVEERHLPHDRIVYEPDHPWKYNYHDNQYKPLEVNLRLEGSKKPIEWCLTPDPTPYHESSSVIPKSDDVRQIAHDSEQYTVFHHFHTLDTHRQYQMKVYCKSVDDGLRLQCVAVPLKLLALIVENPDWVGSDISLANCKIAGTPYHIEFKPDRHTEQSRTLVPDCAGSHLLSVLGKTLQRLHQQISGNPTSPNTSDKSEVRAIIASYTSDQVADCVDRCLQRHVKATGARIGGLRASVVYPFTGDIPCPILQWKEGDLTEVMAIYLVEPDNRLETDAELHDGSWIMHFGRGITLHADGHHWENAFIAWSVTEMSRLKRLFQTAQHLFGILEWSKEDAYRLYCGQGSEECSDDEYLSPWLLN